MNERLDIFDMDRTLINTPEFADFVKSSENGFIDTVKHFSEHFATIKSLFWDIFMREVSFKKEGEHVVVLDGKNKSEFDGMQFSDMVSKNQNVNKYLELDNDTVVVKHPSGFYADPDTLGYNVNNSIFNVYRKIKNKMILTGRGEKLRPEILKMLRFLNMTEPNQGLMLWPGKPKIMEWKAQVIVKAASTSKWNEIHFYEDRADWLGYATEAMIKSYPNIKFVPHHITNIDENIQI